MLNKILFVDCNWSLFFNNNQRRSTITVIEYGNRPDVSVSDDFKQKEIKSFEDYMNNALDDWQ